MNHIQYVLIIQIYLQFFYKTIQKLISIKYFSPYKNE